MNAKINHYTAVTTLRSLSFDCDFLLFPARSILKVIEKENLLEEPVAIAVDLMPRTNPRDAKKSWLAQRRKCRQNDQPAGKIPYVV